MTPEHLIGTTVVVDGRTLRFQVDTAALPEALSVEVVSGRGDLLWESREPGWRAISYGFANGRLYWWSARRLVLVEAQRCIQLAEVDEDIVVAFETASGWVVVTETTVRLVGSEQRLEYGVILRTAWIEHDMLLVEDEDGGSTLVRVGPDSLAIM